MIYLDHGATSFPKPAPVRAAMDRALRCCANPGRGAHTAAMAAAEQVLSCRETAGRMFHCDPEQVIFTSNCTHGLNIALRSLVKPGDRVVVSGFEHNAVTRPLHAIGARVEVAGRQLFCWDEMLDKWEKSLKSGVKIGVFTHISNVFGYILPVDEMAALCRKYGVPFIVDAAQSAGILPVDMEKWGVDFVAMPGHKGLLGPQGTGLLLCGRQPKPLLYGGTGSQSVAQTMPDFLPDRAEAGTLNVPGIAGLHAGMCYVNRIGLGRIFAREREQAAICAEGLRERGARVFAGPHQAGTVSFVINGDCESVAAYLAQRGIAVRAGLHCAPLAHESAGTLETGTVRLSFGHDAAYRQSAAFLQAICRLS